MLIKEIEVLSHPGELRRVKNIVHDCLNVSGRKKAFQYKAEDMLLCIVALNCSLNIWLVTDAIFFQLKERYILRHKLLQYANGLVGNGIRCSRLI